MSQRLNYNKKILELIESMMDTFPDLRFNQILSNLNINKSLIENNMVIGVQDNYYEESKNTYLEAKKSYDKIIEDYLKVVGDYNKWNKNLL